MQLLTFLLYQITLHFWIFTQRIKLNNLIQTKKIIKSDLTFQFVLFIHQ